VLAELTVRDWSVAETPDQNFMEAPSRISHVLSEMLKGTGYSEDLYGVPNNSEPSVNTGEETGASH
jgi:hypothetical protein